MTPTSSNRNSLVNTQRPCSLSSHAKGVRFYGVVLGGGKSRRMHFDKRFLILNGEYLIDRAARVLAESLGQPIDAILLSGVIPGRQAIPDLLSDLGPLGGVHAVLSQLIASSEVSLEHLNHSGDASWAVFLPVDMPYLSVEILHKLLSAVSGGEESTEELEAAHFEGAQLPLCLRVNAKILEQVAVRLKVPDPRERSLKALVSSLKLKKVPLEETEWPLLANFNTPQDLSPETTR